MIMATWKPEREGAGAFHDPTKYLLGSLDSAGKDREIEPEILRGDLQAFRYALRLTRTYNPYTTFALGFQESKEHLIEIGALPAILDKLEEVLFAGRQRTDGVSITVGHYKLPDPAKPKKQLTDIHGGEVNLDLTTGKHIKALFAPAHLKLIGAFQDWANVTFNLYGPSISSQGPFRVPKAKISQGLVESLLSIRSEILQAICGGDVFDHAGIAKVFAQAGWTIRDPSLANCTGAAEVTPPESFGRTDPIKLSGYAFGPASAWKSHFQQHGKGGLTITAAEAELRLREAIAARASSVRGTLYTKRAIKRMRLRRNTGIPDEVVRSNLENVKGLEIGAVVHYLSIERSEESQVEALESVKPLIDKLADLESASTRGDPSRLYELIVSAAAQLNRALELLGPTTRRFIAAYVGRVAAFNNTFDARAVRRLPKEVALAAVQDSLDQRRELKSRGLIR